MATPKQPDDVTPPPATVPTTPPPSAPTTPPPSAPAAPPPLDANGNPYVYAPPPQRQYLLTWLYSLFLGVFGGDRFYLGKVGTGILKLLTVGGLGLWWAIDLIITILGAQTDAQRRPVTGYEQYKKVSWIITGIAVFIGLVLAVARAHAGWDMGGWGMGGWAGLHPYPAAPDIAPTFAPGNGFEWCVAGNCKNS